jgi:hypothetical protein
MSPIFDTWVRLLWGLMLAAIVINVAVALIKPAVPYLVVIAAIIGARGVARWWSER